MNACWSSLAFAALAAAQVRSSPASPPQGAAHVQLPAAKAAARPAAPITAEHQSYFNAIAARLAAQAGITAAPVHIENSDAIRAAISRQCEIALTTGLVRRAQTEAELAGVLAHLLAHLTTSVGQTQPPVCALSRARGRATGLEAQSRESRATTQAAEYLKSSGYDPLEVLSFFDKLRYEEPQFSSAFAVEDLLGLRARLEAEATPARGYVVNTAAFQRVRAGLVPPAAAVSGKAVLSVRKR